MIGRTRTTRIKKSEGIWLLSFCDLSFVLMAFFVLLLSWSKIDKTKVENIKDGMSSKTPPITVDKREIEVKGNRNLRELSNELENIVTSLKLRQQVLVNYDADGLSIEFKDNMIFASGLSEASPQFFNIAENVMKVIAHAPSKYKLVLEGHTDDVPVAGGKFPTNWELSAARGFTLLNILKRRGVAEERMSVVAYAHTNPKVPVLGLTGSKLETARQSNRRVVIRIF